MARFDDLTGKRFTRLIVLKRAERESKKAVYWECLCDCGNKIEVASSSLKAENGTKSCGCLRSEMRKNSAYDYTGQKFGKLTILSRDFSERKDHNPHWKCLCDCGEETVVSISSLKSGETVSCGCFWLEKIRSISQKLNIKKSGDSALNTVKYTYKNNAVKRNLVFDLTDEQFEKFIFNNCGYCGSPPSNKSKNRYGNGDVVYNGIDRINNSIGYVINNCITCCQNCNRAKYKMSYEEFSSWIFKINDILKKNIKDV